MPPRVKITKEEIVKTALELVRESGAQSINARAIAAALNCSTQPIFSNFTTMEKLQEAVIATAYEHYLGYLRKERESGEYPPYKSLGMAYIRFAREEKELFKLLFMRDRSNEDASSGPDFEEAVQMMMKANGITIERARLMHLEIWSCVHGIGVMFATSFLSLEWETVSNMLTDVYQGIRTRYVSGENESDCN